VPISSQKRRKAAALLGNRHGKQGLALLADLGALGDEAQAVEVHVGAAQDGGVGFAFGLVRGHVLLDRRHRQRAGRLDDAARVDEDVLDGRAHGVGVHGHEFVHQPRATRKVSSPTSLTAVPSENRPTSAASRASWPPPSGSWRPNRSSARRSP
jgi:hypothetical protein